MLILKGEEEKNYVNVIHKFEKKNILKFQSNFVFYQKIFF